MPFLLKFLLIYFILISVVAAIMTAADKFFAKKGMWRIPEATLMLVGLLGGATAMFISMKTIRHKTKHKKFMIGLPLMIALHAGLMCAYIYFSYIQI